MADIEREDRRAFLASAGKFALVAPPAVTFLLSTTMSTSAIAQSATNGSCNRGLGNDSEECDPGNSGGKPGAAGAKPGAPAGDAKKPEKK